VIQCTRDHKPARDTECARILKNQGIIYRVANIRGKNEPQMITAKTFGELEKLKILMQDDAILYAGPFRCRPGGLSVTRTFGDIEAKREELGGKPGVVIPDPEISTRIIDSDDDFVIMGSDGIFDS
jgi:serine/threonine protein phosphatase PrpC